MTKSRIGIDFGGSKIEIALLSRDDNIVVRRRIATPTRYEDAIEAIVRLVHMVESDAGVHASVGVGFPGRTNTATGLVRNGNCLNGHPFQSDLCMALGREVRVANDANCFALSEAVDGACREERVVFGAILGTGCGGGIVVDRQILIGPAGVGGEWGHNLFPFVNGETPPGRRCWCGQIDCVETVVSGRALAQEYGGAEERDARLVVQSAANGDERARTILGRHIEHLARVLAQVVNLLDPGTIVLCGGLSNMGHLYAQIPAAMQRYVFGGACVTPVVRAAHGDSSGVRGAAWLWPEE